MTARVKKSLGKITLGPLLFNWEAAKRRDFYFRIADEATVDCVYLGEVVCSKREPFFEALLPAVVDRLKKAKKEIVFSTLAIVTSEREVKAIKARVDQGFLIEANDVACLQALGKKPHVVGPYINVLNEATRDYLARHKATRIVLPTEIPASSIDVVAGSSKVETEVFVFGKQPLSVAMRCYHARAYGLNKDSCRIACAKDPDGLPIDTMDGQPILTINGTQTLSHGIGVLVDKLDDLRKRGVSHFRLSPQDVDMVKVAEVYRAALDGKIEGKEAIGKLKRITKNAAFANGFFFGKEGMLWIGEK